MVIKAHAKISLAIDVGEKGNDQLHPLDMLSIPVDLHDVLEITRLLGTSDTYLTEDDPTIICPETDEAYEAFGMMKRDFDLKKGFRIQIYKRIPSEAGLGGGAADAAGVILAMCKAHKIPLDDPRIGKIAAQLGVNVPFFLKGMPARLTGRGNDIQVLPDLSFHYGVLIVKPKEGLKSADVFKQYDAMPLDQREHPDINALLAAIKAGDEAAIQKNMVNGLTKPAEILYPEIGNVLSKMKELNLPLCAMSGSGSACFGLSKDKKVLKEALWYFNSLGYVTALTSTIVKD